MTDQLELMTYYAPAERDEKDKICEQISIFKKTNFLEELIKDSNDVSMILNKNRQILFINVNEKEDEVESIIGVRPGEYINCIYSNETEYGCGTSIKCKYCGVVNAIIESQEKKSKVTSESRMTILKNGIEESIEFMVSANTIEVENQLFTLLTLTDVSEKKRKMALERIFYHDIVNKVGGIKGLIELMSYSIKDIDDKTKKILTLVYKSSSDLIDEILMQRDLVLAENSELQLNISSININEILNEIALLYNSHEVSAGKTIKIDADTCNVEIQTDKYLLNRVLVNLMKNALEAVPHGDHITVGCNELDENVEFFVHNKNEIQNDIKMQIFRRAYSTKSKDRGYGTYSVKLLTERYLMGSVFFVSEKIKGTTFYIVLPKIHPKNIKD